MADVQRRKNVVLENVQIMFRNFAGAKKQYNDEGDRNFVVFLDEQTAAGMLQDGFNVKRLKPREDDDEGQAYLTVKVGYNYQPPKVVLVSNGGMSKTTLDEETVGVADMVIIKTSDLIISPSNWEVNGRKGVSAWLKSIFITIEEDELDEKYRDLEEIGAGSENHTGNPKSGVHFDGGDEPY